METVCGLKKTEHDLPVPAESRDHSDRSWLFGAVPGGEQRGPEGPGLRARGLAVSGVCLTAQPVLPSCPPFPVSPWFRQ